LADPALDDLIAEAEVLVTSWGAPRFEAPLLDRMPRLRAVFHAAGSIRHHVSADFWDRRIRITTAADAYAVPVAEFTLAAIRLAGKRARVQMRTPSLGQELWGGNLRAHALGNLDRTVG